MIHYFCICNDIQWQWRMRCGCKIWDSRNIISKHHYHHHHYHEPTACQSPLPSSTLLFSYLRCEHRFVSEYVYHFTHLFHSLLGACGDFCRLYFRVIARVLSGSAIFLSILFRISRVVDISIVTSVGHRDVQFICNYMRED